MFIRASRENCIHSYQAIGLNSTQAIWARRKEAITNTITNTITESLQKKSTNDFELPTTKL